MAAVTKQRGHTRPLPWPKGTELRRRVERPLGVINRAFLDYLGADRIIAYGHPGDVTRPPVRIPTNVWPSFRYVDYARSSVQETKEGVGRFAAVRVYPVVKAPCAVQVLAGQPLEIVFRKCVLEDPEVLSFGRMATHDDALFQRTLDGFCHPQGFPLWRVYSDDPTGHRDEVIGCLADPKPEPVMVAAAKLSDRFSALFDLLRTGELVAQGVPVRRNDPSLLPKSIWYHKDFYLDAATGDIQQINPNATGFIDMFVKRWLAVLLDVATESVAQSNAATAKRRLRYRPKSQRVLAAIKEAGIDLASTELSNKEIAGTIASKLGVRVAQEHTALAKMVGRLRREV